MDKSIETNVSRLIFPELLNHPFRYPPERFQRLLDPFRSEGGIETKTVTVPVAKCENCTGGNADPFPQGRIFGSNQRARKLAAIRVKNPEDI